MVDTSSSHVDCIRQTTNNVKEGSRCRHETKASRSAVTESILCSIKFHQLDVYKTQIPLIITLSYLTSIKLQIREGECEKKTSSFRLFFFCFVSWPPPSWKLACKRPVCVQSWRVPNDWSPTLLLRGPATLALVGGRWKRTVVPSGLA